MQTKDKPKPLSIGIIITLISMILLLTGSFLSVDWMNALQQLGSSYPAFIKPLVSTLCAVLVIISFKNSISKRDSALLGGAFLCIVIVDITMSIYVYMEPGQVTQIAFLIGASLSIVAHILLLIRHSCGFEYLRRNRADTLREVRFALYFFMPVLVVLIILSPYLQKVGQFWPSLIYALILTASLWVAWELIRQKLYPRPSRYLIAAGVTSWFITEIIGVIHNIQIGFLSEISVPLTWHFYMPAILLLALSGFAWENPDLSE